MNLPYDEYHYRVQQNIDTFRTDYELNRSIRASDFHFFEKDKYEQRRLHEFEHSWDIIGATLVGDLPSNKKHGADGFRLLPSGEYLEMEYKISCKYQSSIWQTPLGALNTGIGNITNRTTSLRSGFHASFDIKNNLESKNRLTNLFVFDETTQQYIAGFQLTGQQVIDYLSKKASPSKSIKLSHFINYGIQVDLTVPSYGSYPKWEKMLKDTVPILQKNEYRLDK